MKNNAFNILCTFGISDVNLSPRLQKILKTFKQTMKGQRKRIAGNVKNVSKRIQGTNMLILEHIAQSPDAIWFSAFM